MNPPLITRHLLDNSVLARVQRGEIAPSVLAPFIHGENELVACTPQMIEALYSTRSPAEWETEYARRWSHLRVLPTDLTTHDIALEIQRRLWAAGKVRAAGTVDVLTAAIAMQHSAIVVHRDSDYERIAEVAPEFRQVRV
ncbi:PIN domain-containing protein [Tsukamurella ocularis]|uniref:PIN domain-containing protein n=1 Tax=Tsukamurella ocularis TaxID=1970234 RepID=UPI0039F09409